MKKNLLTALILAVAAILSNWALFFAWINNNWPTFEVKGKTILAVVSMFTLQCVTTSILLFFILLVVLKDKDSKPQHFES